MDVDADTGIAACKSCGCKVQIFDRSELKKEEKTVRIIDEARQKEAEARQKEIDLSLKKLEFEKEKQDKEVHGKKIKLVIGLSSLLIGVILFTIGLVFSTDGAGNTQINPVSYLMLPGIAGIIVGVVFMRMVFQKRKMKNSI